MEYDNKFMNPVLRIIYIVKCNKKISSQINHEFLSDLSFYQCIRYIYISNIRVQFPQENMIEHKCYLVILEDFKYNIIINYLFICYT